jgi:hypothetical protein
MNAELDRVGADCRPDFFAAGEWTAIVDLVLEMDSSKPAPS